jgi:Fur family peroxide stress response transcriptional regulator
MFLTIEVPMTIPEQEIVRRLQLFESVCRDGGIKITHQRAEIFREVAQTDDHPDAEQVYRRVRGRLPRVSLDTVYRTLWLLKDLGLVVTNSRGQERTRFDANLKEHHHFVCNSCGLTRDIGTDELDALTVPAAVNIFGRVESSHVEIRGTCHGCISEKT